METFLSKQYSTNEHKLIEKIKDWAGELFIGDDCAVIANHQLVTTDTLVEGTHFALPLISCIDLGWKAIAVNLSDVAAMAGKPRYVLISLTIPPQFSRNQLRELYTAMTDCARYYKSVIVGGDLTKGPILSITITVLADIHDNGYLLRSGARPGDVVIVTGDFGASAAGLWLLEQLSSGNKCKTANKNYCMTKHVHPQPKLHEAWQLVQKVGNRGALMDASDGLADALVQISRASKVGMQIDLSLVPIHKETNDTATKAKLDPLEWALYGGEDYELVGCMPQILWSNWAHNNPFTKIGMITDSQTIELTVQNRPGPKLDLSKSFEQISECTAQRKGE